MGKIIAFPKSCNQEMPSRQSSELLAEIKELIWKDPETYFSLEASCFLGTPSCLKERRKLRLLNLINEFGLPTPETAEIIMSMAVSEPDVSVVGV